MSTHVSFFSVSKLSPHFTPECTIDTYHYDRFDVICCGKEVHSMAFKNDVPMYRFLV